MDNIFDDREWFGAYLLIALFIPKIQKNIVFAYHVD